MKKRLLMVLFILLTAVCLFTFSACGAADNGDNGNNNSSDENGGIEEIDWDDGTDGLFDNDVDPEDLYHNEDWSEGYVQIVFNGGSANVTGLSDNYFTIDGANVTVAAAEALTYVLSGYSEDGRVVFNKKNEDHIILNGLSLTSRTSAPLSLMKKADRMLTIADDTTNILTDADKYTVFDDTDEPNAALFSKNSLTIGGKGTLIVTSNYNNGIGSKDNLIINSGNISVTAANNALKGNDSVVIAGGTIKLTSEQDAIKSDEVSDASEPLGFVEISDATVSITAKEDAVQAAKYLSVSSGKITVSTNGGAAANTSSSSNNNNNNNRPGWGWNEVTTGDDTSRKGLKADESVIISGGSFNFDCYDDAIHSNGSVNISGGTFYIKTGDDAVHADKAVNITDGAVNIASCYEGLESAKVTIDGGDIKIVATDDGVNASDGTNNVVGVNNTNCALTVNGGTLYVKSSGDGLDSNGVLNINGGKITVHGPSSTPDEAFDADGGMYFNGGTAVGGGASSLMDKPNSGSTQNVIVIYLSSAASAGTVITVKDNAGNEVVSYTGEKQFQSVIMSCADFTSNGTYKIYRADSLVDTVTLSSRITNVGSSSGGTGGPGGGRP